MESAFVKKTLNGKSICHYGISSLMDGLGGPYSNRKIFGKNIEVLVAQAWCNMGMAGPGTPDLCLISITYAVFPQAARSVPTHVSV